VKTRRLLGFTVACALTFAFARVASAYQDEGHLFTTAGVVYLSAPTTEFVGDPPRTLTADVAHNPDALRIIVLCSQLPDQTLEYDAIQVVHHSLSLGSQSGGNWLRWVQQDLHALTGGSRALIRTAGEQIVTQAHHTALAGKGDFADYCALGFAIHFLGDSYAHYPFDDEGHMYKSPVGHAGDRHQPDLPAYDADGSHGFTNWSAYVAALSRALELPSCSGIGACPNAISDLEMQFKAALDANILSRDLWGELSDWRANRTEESGQTAERAAIRNVLAKSANPAPPTTVPDATGGIIEANEPCDAYLARSLTTPGGFRFVAGNPGPGMCAEVWKRYTAIAGKILTAQPDEAFASPSDRANAQPDNAGYPP